MCALLNWNAFQLKAHLPIKNFFDNDLDIDPLTLTLKLDLDMVKMYHHTKNEDSESTASKVITQTDRQTDRPTHTDTTHKREEIN